MRTTCAYCGVGCSFKAEVKDEQVVRMVPDRDGGANRGHACVKGRFAYGYATHADRITKPMIRLKITDPWREVSWDEAFEYAASEFKRIQAKYGRFSGRWNHFLPLHQRRSLPGAEAGPRRAGHEQCRHLRARLPFAHGLWSEADHGRVGWHAEFRFSDEDGRDARNRGQSTDGHPVFGSRMKRRLREGAKLIVADPREIDLVRSPHVQADYHLQLRPGHQCGADQLLGACSGHRRAGRREVRRRALRTRPLQRWKDFVSEPKNSPEAMESVTGVPARLVRGAARLFATGGNGAIYYGLGVTEHSQGSTMVMGIAQLAMATGNLGREGVGVNPFARPEQCAGRLRHGVVPARTGGLPAHFG